jgi:mono/diheme cytochrome c family protein
MKSVCVLAVIVLLAAASLTLWAAEDGTALFKEKCSACHGEKGEGNSSIPAVKGTSMTAEQLVTYLTKGQEGKTMHAGPFGDITADQAKAIAQYAKGLK